jgi:hypothetical protein
VLVRVVVVMPMLMVVVMLVVMPMLVLLVMPVLVMVMPVLVMVVVAMLVVVARLVVMPVVVIVVLVIGCHRHGRQHGTDDAKILDRPSTPRAPVPAPRARRTRQAMRDAVLVLRCSPSPCGDVAQ